MKGLSLIFGIVFISCSVSCTKGAIVELKLKTPVKFCFFGDGGTGDANQAAVAKLLIEEDCQAYFYLGDIVYPKGISSKLDPRLKRLFLDVYTPILKKRPMFLTMGNHDYQGNVDAWLEVAKERANLYYPAHFYLVRAGGFCFPVMNTTDYKASQSIWLRRLDLSTCGEVILIGHHPAKSSGRHAKPYFPLNLFLWHALKFGQTYIAGHDHHLSYEGEVQGVDQFVSGAAGQLRELDKQKAFWGKSQLGYLVMTGAPGETVYTFWGVGEKGEKEKLFSKKISNHSLAHP